MRVQGDNMPNQTENCEFKGCEKKFTFTNVSDYVELMKAHNAAKHNGGGANSSTKPEKAKRPELSGEVSDEDWAYFCDRFDQYKTACKLTETEDIVTQLLECASDRIRRDHHRAYSGVGTRDEKTILEQLKTIAVKKQNIAANRMKLGSMKQGHGEPVRKFAGRVRSLATVCEYTVKVHQGGLQPDHLRRGGHCGPSHPRARQHRDSEGRARVRKDEPREAAHIRRGKGERPRVRGEGSHQAGGPLQEAEESQQGTCGGDRGWGTLSM